jgi:hypothetical protein
VELHGSMPKSRPSPDAFSNLPPGRQYAIIGLIVSSLALGVVLALSAPRVQLWAFSIMGSVITTLGAAASFLRALVSFRYRRILVGISYGVMSILLLLLSLPEWQQLGELATGAR